MSKKTSNWKENITLIFSFFSTRVGHFRVRSVRAYWGIKSVVHYSCKLPKIPSIAANCLGKQTKPSTETPLYGIKFITIFVFFLSCISVIKFYESTGGTQINTSSLLLVVSVQLINYLPTPRRRVVFKIYFYLVFLQLK